MSINLAYIMFGMIVVGFANLNCTLDTLNGLLTGVTTGMFVACVSLRAFR